MEINPTVDISKYAGEGAVPERADEAGGAGPRRQGARHKLRLSCSSSILLSARDNEIQILYVPETLTLSI